MPLTQWDLRVGPAGTLWSGAADLVALVRTYGSPLHVVRAEELDRAVSEATACAPAVDVFYSYKTNPVPAVLRRLHERGLGAEVISPYELWLAFELGVPGERIVYNGPGKSPDSVRSAIEREVHLVTANSVGDASMIAGVARSMRRRVRLGLRVSFVGTWGGQFGVAAASGRDIEVVRAALDDAFVDLRGLHVHRGLSMRDAGAFDDHVRAVLGHCDRLRAATGWHPAVIDLGGSLGCPTVAPIPRREFRLNRALGTDLLPPDAAACITVGAAAAHAEALVHDHARRHGLAPPGIILEPGRAVTSSSQFLLTTVLDVKDDVEPAHAILDAGINVAEPMRGEYHQLFSVTAPMSPAVRPYRLAGPICTPADVLCNSWRLPELEPGHVLAIMDTGAYFVPFATSFSFPQPAIVMQDGDAVTVVRRAEVFGDLVARDQTLRDR